jgi:hypothetical protein
LFCVTFSIDAEKQSFVERSAYIRQAFKDKNDSDPNRELMITMIKRADHQELMRLSGPWASLGALTSKIIQQEAYLTNQ